MKTLIDYTFSIIAVVVLIPLFIFYALIILILSHERPFYSQERALGKNDCKLMIYKLRTIKNISEIKHENNNTLKKNISDNSYLPFGKLLRKTGLDETPQLLNILMGKMSLIGPRPLTLKDIDLINEVNPAITLQRSKLKSKPGISGMWQIYRTSSFDFNEILKWDLYYENNHNFFLDAKLLYKTIVQIITFNHIDTIE